ncbi:hypothetical protein ACFGVS_00865 [Mucilaginibacter sp. AW1-7]|uniref:hypothetical protein n=1 Tax=Mucilaginibacter sp. AW1-7 TaxID=3349874 RepID=UPI003F73A296
MKTHLIQSVIDTLYRHPLSALKRLAKFGGYFSYRRMLYNQRLMEKAAVHLPPVHTAADGLPVYFLTGKKYLYQTLFCIASLTRHSTENFHFILVDDGTFDAPLIGLVNRQLPGATIITRDIVEHNLERHLPESRYPCLRNKRAEYPHIKKLTDIHTLPGRSWKLVIDSDMLFQDEPAAMISWLKKPDMPIHMKDCQESYGYSRGLMEQLAGAKIPPLLNVGIIGLNSAQVNWDKLETWVSILEEKEGKTYYLEQALSAMLVGTCPAVLLPADRYIVNPGTGEILNGTGILHHYVDLSKKGYFNLAWRRFIP